MRTRGEQSARRFLDAHFLDDINVRSTVDLIAARTPNGRIGASSGAE